VLDTLCIGVNVIVCNGESKEWLTVEILDGCVLAEISEDG
jgi:hypothetical protein